jgi:hypothetical protein
MQIFPLPIVSDKKIPFIATDGENGMAEMML